MKEITRAWLRQRTVIAAFMISFVALSCHASTEPTSKLECQDVGDQIVCQVVLDKSASQWTLEHCNEDDGYCLEAVIKQKPEIGMPSLPHRVKTPRRGSLAEEFMERMASQRERRRVAALSMNDEYVLTVGTQSYEQPYEQYGAEVANALTDLAGEISRNAGDLDLADAYTVLAMAHRGESDIMLASFPLSNDEISIEDVNGAINAFQEGLRLYQLALKDIRLPTERDYVSIAIGTTASVLADTYQMSGDEAHAKKALEFYTLSESTFGSLLREGASRMDAATYEDIELRWAGSASRMAVLQIEMIQRIQVEAQDVMGSSTLPNFDSVLNDVREGQTKLEEAIKVYRIAVGRNERYPGQKIEQKQFLANALFSAGSASVLLAQNEKAIEEWEEALQIFRQLASNGDSKASNGDSVEQAELKSVIAELLFCLSDSYLQMGMYDETNDRYGEAMKLFSQQGFPVEVANAQMDVLYSEDVLQMHEDNLREYQASVNGYGGQNIHIPDDYRDPNEPDYERDDLYEAGLHASIGAFRVARNEMEVALDHFNQAVSLYSNNLGDQDRVVADMKLNLSSVYLTLTLYEESEKAHREAVEIYRVVVGEGQNPLLNEELLGELKGATPELFKDKDGDGKEDAFDDNEKVHERLIDVDDYRRGLLNLTKTVMDEL